MPDLEARISILEEFKKNHEQERQEFRQDFRDCTQRIERTVNDGFTRVHARIDTVDKRVNDVNWNVAKMVGSFAVVVMVVMFLLNTFVKPQEHKPRRSRNIISNHTG